MKLRKFKNEDTKEIIKYAKKIYNIKPFNLGIFIDNVNALLNCYLSGGFKTIRLEKNVFKFNNEYWDCVEILLT